MLRRSAEVRSVLQQSTAKWERAKWGRAKWERVKWEMLRLVLPDSSCCSQCLDDTSRARARWLCHSGIEMFRVAIVRQWRLTSSAAVAAPHGSPVRNSTEVFDSLTVSGHVDWSCAAMRPSEQPWLCAV
jgi:hypothetical protein